MDHSKHTRLELSELTPEIVHGATVYDQDDNSIGSIAHLHGTVVAIDVGGVFGIGAKRVAVPATELDIMRDEDGVVHAVSRLTEELLKSMPEHSD